VRILGKIKKKKNPLKAMLSILFLLLKWNVKAVTMTGTAVKRSKKETWLSK
jgi:hypothetical protein